MGSKTLAERVGLPISEAEEIIDSFYEGFQGVKKFTEESQAMLKEYGYVTDMWGRRRHIPDATLKDFEVTISEEFKNSTFNPLLNCSNNVIDSNTERLIEGYQNLLNKSKNKYEIENIKKEAIKHNLEVKDNRGFINRSLRQCLNARIQSTAASMTKAAMIRVDRDKELNDLGFHLLVTVHDEVFGECPRENADKVAERLSYLMVEAAKDKCICKFKCDPYITSRWYEDEATAEVLKDYNKLLSKSISEEDALNKIKEKYCMINEKYVEQICNGTYECNTHSDI